MDHQKLIEAARKDGGEQDFASLLQAELQDGVTSAVTTLATENAELKTSVGKLETSGRKAMDELKPLQKVLREAEVGWKGDDLPLLAARLKKGGGKPSDDVMEIARSLAGPMAAEATKQLQEDLVKSGAELEAAKTATAAEQARADTSNLQLQMQAAQVGKDDPQLIPAFADVFRQKILEPYAHWSDVTTNGSTRRVLEFRDGDVPIVTAKGPAGVADMMRTAYEGKGDKAYSTLTRDYYQSVGGGAGTPLQGAADRPAGQTALAGAETLDEFEKLRGQGA